MNELNFEINNVKLDSDSNSLDLLFVSQTYEIKHHQAELDDKSARLKLIEDQFYQILKINGNSYPFYFYSNDPGWDFYVGKDKKFRVENESHLQYQARFYAIASTADKYTIDYLPRDFDCLDRAYERFQKQNVYKSFNDFINFDPNPYFDGPESKTEKYKINQTPLTLDDYISFDHFMKIHAITSPENHHEVEYNNYVGDLYKECEQNNELDIKLATEILYCLYYSYRSSPPNKNEYKTFKSYLCHSGQWECDTESCPR